MKSRILLKELKPHEKTSTKRVRELAADLRKRGQQQPLLVDARFFIILDGHHRAQALAANGEEFAEAVLVDYSSENVKVFARRRNIPVSKELVVERALTGKPFPCKTTRHEREINV